MAIYIKDTTAANLLDDVMALSGEKTKTAAIIEALRQRKATLEAKTPPSERIKPLQGRLRALGGKTPHST